MDIRLNELNKTIINCKKCPRLVKFVKKVSTNIGTIIILPIVKIFGIFIFIRENNYIFS